MNARAHAAAAPARFDLLKAESYVRGEGMLAVWVDEPIAAVCAQLERSAAAGGHEILLRRNVAASLREPGQSPQPGQALWVYEIDHPGLLAQLLAADPAMAHALPCRVVVHDAHGVVTVAAARPTVCWHELSHAPQVARIAGQVEASLQRLLQRLQ